MTRLIEDPAIEPVPEIEEFVVENRAVRFRSGRAENNIDHVVFCTGYIYSFPFLTSLVPPVVSNGDRAQNIYQHIFYHPTPTLCFIGLPQRTVPLPLSEAQGAVIARVLSGRLVLPLQKEMQQWEVDLIADRGAEKAFHTFGYPLDLAYINHLHDWSMQAIINKDLDNNGNGKVPPYWGLEMQWIRERTPLIKAASRDLGPDRHKVTSLKDLGFDFEKWRLQACAEKISLL